MSAAPENELPLPIVVDGEGGGHARELSRASTAPVAALRGAGHDVQSGEQCALPSVVRADHEQKALGDKLELGVLVREEVRDLQLGEVHVRASITRRRTLDSTASNMPGTINAACRRPRPVLVSCGSRGAVGPAAASASASACRRARRAHCSVSRIAAVSGATFGAARADSRDLPVR
jgi:hypothetical protein